MPFTVPAPAFDTCADNDAGVRQLDIIADKDLTFPLPAVDANTRTISTALTLVDPLVAGFETYPFTEETCRHTENSNDQGTFDHIVESFIPRDDAEKRHTFAEMAKKCEKFTIIYTDENNEVKLIPSMVFARDFDTGAATSDRNGYTVRFTKTGAAAYKYTGAIPRKT